MKKILKFGFICYCYLVELLFMVVNIPVLIFLMTFFVFIDTTKSFAEYNQCINKIGRNIEDKVKEIETEENDTLEKN